MKLIHVNEPEHNQKVTDNQAKAILKFKPEVILFEVPKSSSLSYFNKFFPNKKPKQRFEKLKRDYELASKKYPWLKSELKDKNKILYKYWKKLSKS
ncbi:MAG: hypothetical protein AABX99_00710 [Nanoarchaeota archaeon]